MKSSRFVCTIFRFKNKDSRKNQTLSLALNCYFLYTVLCHVIYGAIVNSALQTVAQPPFSTQIAT